MPEKLSPDQPTDAKSGQQSKVVTVQISFCPKLGLYHLMRQDGHYYFDSVQLEQGLGEDLQAGNQKKAEYTARLTSWARLFPHKVVTFFADLSFEIREPVVAKVDDEGGGQQDPQASEGK